MLNHKAVYKRFCCFLLYLLLVISRTTCTYRIHLVSVYPAEKCISWSQHQVTREVFWTSCDRQNSNKPLKFPVCAINFNSYHFYNIAIITEIKTYFKNISWNTCINSDESHTLIYILCCKQHTAERKLNTKSKFNWKLIIHFFFFLNTLITSGSNFVQV